MSCADDLSMCDFPYFTKVSQFANKKGRRSSDCELPREPSGCVQSKLSRYGANEQMSKYEALRCGSLKHSFSAFRNIPPLTAIIK